MVVGIVIVVEKIDTNWNKRHFLLSHLSLVVLFLTARFLTSWDQLTCNTKVFESITPQTA